MALALLFSKPPARQLPHRRRHPVDDNARILVDQQQKRSAAGSDELKRRIGKTNALALPGDPAKAIQVDIRALRQDDGHVRKISMKVTTIA